MQCILIYFVTESNNAFRYTEQELGDVSSTDYPIIFFLQLSFLFLGLSLTSGWTMSAMAKATLFLLILVNLMDYPISLKEMMKHQVKL